jgi:hypothetical protein
VITLSIAVGGELSLDVIGQSGAVNTVRIGIDLETEHERHLLRAGGLFSVLLHELGSDGGTETGLRA